MSERGYRDGQRYAREWRENVLLTYPQIRGDVFAEAVAADAPVRELGRALNDPRTWRCGRLTRWRIRQLAKRGNLVAAQRLILRRL